MTIYTQERYVGPIVKFETMSVEDAFLSSEKGHYVAKDVDIALVSAPSSRDIMRYNVAQWIEQLKTDEHNGRCPQGTADRVTAAYEAFKKNKEPPLNGTSIKTVTFLSPAQVDTLLRMSINTVELLADMNAEGLERVGMGSVAMRDKARAWLKAAQGDGKLVNENAKLVKENKQLKDEIAKLKSDIKALEAESASA